MKGDFIKNRKTVLKLKKDAEAVFIKRINRFLATVNIINPYEEKNVMVHVHDPGRLKELLYSGNRVLLKKAKNKNRKTKWDLIASKNKKSWILTNTMFHRDIFINFIKDKELSPIKDFNQIQPEIKFKKSRLDFLILKNNRKLYIETKGVTLKDGSLALFPDAPTKRGARHVKELIEIYKNGCESYLFFLIFLNDVKFFKPNKFTDPDFANIFYRAKRIGVNIFYPVFGYDGGSIYFEKSIKLKE